MPQNDGSEWPFVVGLLTHSNGHQRPCWLTYYPTDETALAWQYRAGAMMPPTGVTAAGLLGRMLATGRRADPDSRGLAPWASDPTTSLTS